MKRVLFLIPILFFFLIPTVFAWLPNFQYRKSITITNNQQLTTFEFAFNCSGNCQINGEDIRVTTSADVERDFGLEKIGSDNFNITVRTPYNETLYVYYGNSSVTFGNESSGGLDYCGYLNPDFHFVDGFEIGDLWTIPAYHNASWYFANLDEKSFTINSSISKYGSKSVRAEKNDGDNNDFQSLAFNSSIWNTDDKMRLWIRTDDYNIVGEAYSNRLTNAGKTDLSMIIQDNGNFNWEVYNDANNLLDDTPQSNIWYLWEMTLINSTHTNFTVYNTSCQIDVSQGGNLSTQIGTYDTHNFNSTILSLRDLSTWGSGEGIYVDEFSFSPNNAFSLPTVTIGSEETYTPPSNVTVANVTIPFIIDFNTIRSKKCLADNQTLQFNLTFIRNGERQETIFYQYCENGCDTVLNDCRLSQFEELGIFALWIIGIFFAFIIGYWLLIYTIGY